MQSGWEQLSASSQRAFQFAWAAAAERTAGPDQTVMVDSSDLLVGILLSHPGTSEPELTFRQYGLVAGQTLPPGYPRLTIDNLQRRLDAIPVDSSPPTTSDVDQIVNTAIQFASGTADGITHMGAIWVALLQTTNPASTAIRDLLSRRGINASELITRSLDWVALPNRGSYQQVLEQFPVGAVDIVNYMADVPRQAASSGDAAAVDDFVGISAEVDAFAYLLASRSLKPPLAVGLFGDWGSGKSYFLEAIKRRIDQLTQSPAVEKAAQRDTQFWKRIVQVDFNAWHYVEGDLWSSLVHHIFEQLNLASERASDNTVERRQRYLLRHLETTAARLKQLRTNKLMLTVQLEAHRDRVQQLAQRRDTALQKLKLAESDKIRDCLASSSQKAVIDALRSVQLDSGAKSVKLGEAIDALNVARGELERGSALVRPFLENPKQLVILAVFLVGAPFIAAAIENVTHSTTGAAFGGLASLVTMLSAAIGIGSRWVRQRLDLIDRARQEVNREIAQAEDMWRREIAAAEIDVERAGRQLEQVRRSEMELEQKLKGIESDLDKRPAELLYDFLRDRLEAGDYRERLGLPAIIRRDFKRLADLISYQNDWLLAEPDQKQGIQAAAQTTGDLLPENSPLILNRIILYIDDLDRCPDGKVVEVLQAVHLLLAFPLFAVVVAVDSRWLAYALQSRYPALSGVASVNGSASARPDDYLEKIFQIPFWVSPLTDSNRSMIVRGLLGSHVRAEPVGQTIGAKEAIRIGPAEAKVLEEMVDPRSGPPLLDVTALTVSPDELAFLDNLAALMGDTPRSVKRFVNVYQLVKILRRAKAGVVTGMWPTDDQLVALLLTVAEGLPELGWRLFDELSKNSGPLTLKQLLSNSTLSACATERDRLTQWLDTSPGIGGVSTERLAPLVSDVRRFLFRLVRPGTEPPNMPRPQLVHLIRER